jgi:N-acetyl-gamma-glutamyl-phosphate reductase
VNAPASANAAPAPAGASGVSVSAGVSASAGAPASGVAPGGDSREALPVARVAVLGASGYSGHEFARLALAHPGLRIAALSSREHAGHAASALLPGVDPRAIALPTVLDAGGVEELLGTGGFDTLVVCLPHGAWKALAAEMPALATAPQRVVDLSADHRDGSASPAGGPDYRYGLPEAFRADLLGATHVANPGCYPTAAALALLPAAEAGWLEGPVMVNALSGVSGAGRRPELRNSFVELDGGASLYKAGTEHGHVAEMERTLAALGAAVPVGFAPQLVPMARGILLTASVRLARPIAPDEARSRYADRYQNEPFVRVLSAGEWPATRAVRGSNRCDVAVTTLHGGRTLFVSSAIDNLVKGAAGQAIQNLNLMLGWPEVTGLTPHGSPW